MNAETQRPPRSVEFGSEQEFQQRQTKEISRIAGARAVPRPQQLRLHRDVEFNLASLSMPGRCDWGPVALRCGCGFTALRTLRLLVQGNRAWAAKSRRRIGKLWLKKFRLNSARDFWRGFVQNCRTL